MCATLKEGVLSWSPLGPVFFFDLFDATRRGLYEVVRPARRALRTDPQNEPEGLARTDRTQQRWTASRATYRRATANGPVPVFPTRAARAWRWKHRTYPAKPGPSGQ